MGLTIDELQEGMSKDIEIDKGLDLKKMAPTKKVLISSVLLALFLLFSEHI